MKIEFTCSSCGRAFLAYASEKRRFCSHRCSSDYRLAHGLRHGHGHSKLGGGQSPEYRVWHSMTQRCGNPNAHEYPSYGGAGITVCDRWKTFEHFLTDMGPRPSLKHSIDRFPNQRGNYEPGNCRWATPKEQTRNKETNVVLTYDGKTQVLTDWAKEYGLHKETLRCRIFKLGWPLDRALTERRHRNAA